MRTAMQRRGFTLIELLVVIAIIGMLLAIIIPALRRAKRQAKLMICGTHQRQLAYGLATYASDNDGKLPPHPSHPFEMPEGNYHRPFELNWYGNQVQYSTSVDYPFAGRYLYDYLGDVEVFNCALSGIKAGTPWPPRGSGLDPVGTYGEFYRTGHFMPLHSTYMLLWNYQGYNHKVSNHVDRSQGHFEGPSRMSSRNKLVVQDSLFYLTSNTNILWPSPQQTWYTSHSFRGSERVDPYYRMRDPDMAQFPEVWLSAGYLDGHVSKFKSDTMIGVKNYQAQAYMTREFR